MIANVSVFAVLISFYKSDALNNRVSAASNFFGSNPTESYLEFICAPDIRIVDPNTMRMSYVNWMSGTGELLFSSTVVPNDNDGVSSAGAVSWGGYIPPRPVIPTPPPTHHSANVGISISVGGNTYDAGDQYGCCAGASDGYI